jgi:hypothetical protein
MGASENEVYSRNGNINEKKHDRPLDFGCPIRKQTHIWNPGPLMFS